jgi:hypothetical protein
MTKVAILLRGQGSRGELGAIAFEHMVKKFFPNVEFKIFIATWSSLSWITELTDVIPTQTTHQAFNFNIMTDEYIYDSYIKHWSPESYSIGKLSSLLNISETIYNKNLETLDFNTHYNNYRKVVGDNVLTPLCPLSPTGTALRNTRHIDDIHPAAVKKVCILAHNIGQVYAAGKAFGLLEEYSNKTGWTPDIVINGRPDLIRLYDDAFFDKCMDLFKKREVILTQRVLSMIGLSWIHDFQYVTSYDVAKRFVTNDIDAQLVNSLHTNRHKLFSVMDGIVGMPHALWGQIQLDQEIRIDQVSTYDIRMIASPLRIPHDSFMDIMNTYNKNTRAEFNRVLDKVFFPVKNVSQKHVTDQEVWDTMCKLRDN